MSDVPLEIAIPIASAMSLAMGILWNRLIKKEDQATKDLRDLVNAYHSLVVAIHKSIDIKDGDNPPLSATGE